MNFKFNVVLSDDDYLELNKFIMLRSHYGKKQIGQSRVIAAVGIGALIALSLIFGEFTLGAFLMTIPYSILLGLFIVFLPNMMSAFLKSHIKQMKKDGKLPYTPSSVVEFFDDSFTEVAEDNKTELKYSSVERVSVVGGKTVYIHFNSLAAIILPKTSFESDERYGEFLEFIKTKCAEVNFYPARK
ncbi:MAG: YcxB family protein [Ruminococcaceae bacterium]|nr:YcxB family protein [Oscillospiraceae bacterium]